MKPEEAPKSQKVQGTIPLATQLMTSINTMIMGGVSDHCSFAAEQRNTIKKTVMA